MSAEYTVQVLEDYKKKKAQNSLSYNLIALTTAKIKKECLIVFDKRFEKRDEKLLKYFFDERGENLELRQAVKKCEPDRFRALIKFLKGLSKSTDEKNIELLAWLIDFADRPYKPDYEKMYQINNLDTLENSVLNEEKIINNTEQKVLPVQPLIQTVLEDEVKEDNNLLVNSSTNNTENTSPKRSNTVKPIIKKVLYLSISTVALVSIVLFLRKTDKKEKEVQALLPEVGKAQTCMFWAENHYQRTSCNQHPENVKVYAFDAQKSACFKKITMPDTITLRALGRVWYVKIDGEIEYYTSAGFHPIHTDLRLKPLTEYIYNKYLHH